MKQSDNVSGQRSQLSPAKQALLEKRLRGELKRLSPRNEIPPRPQQNPVPLSFAQQRLWFLQQLYPESHAYNIFNALRWSAPLDIALLEKSINEVVRRHEVLRTTFAVVDEPVQVIAPQLTLTLPVVDLSNLPIQESLVEAYRLASEEAQRPFDLSVGPLLRVSLLRLEEQDYILLLTMHHIVSDAWSLGVFNREVFALYEAFCRGASPPLDELPIQYADYAVWQRQWFQGKVLESQLSYWKQQLADAPSHLELPMCKPRQAVQTFRGETQTKTFPKALYDDLSKLSQQEQCTLFMTLLTAFYILLYRYTGQPDVLVGTPAINRARVETQALVGFFANTLVLRADLSGNPSFRQLLRRVREIVSGALAHQDLPFEILVKELHPRRDVSRTPLFQVMFNVQNAELHATELLSSDLRPFEIEIKTAKFDLMLLLVVQAEGISASWEYKTDLFESDSITRMAGHFQTLLEAIATDPEQRIAALPLLTAEEQHYLQVELNATRVEYPTGKTLHHLFEAQVELTPDAIAVVFEQEQVSYRELNSRAERVAEQLRRIGVGAELLVGICVERSIEMVVGILGILKAGGAYLPLDPSYPAERLSYMVEDADVAVVLTQNHLVQLLQEIKHEGHEEVEGIVIIVRNPETLGSSRANSIPVSPDNLAYVIYTSGSTGRPKGSLISHRNVIRLFEATRDRFNFDESDIWTLYHSFAFDFSVWELWGALIYGGRLVIVPYLVSRSPDAFYQLLIEQQVTVLNQTPSAFRQLIKAEEGIDGDKELSLRVVIFGGEALELQSLRPWYERHSDIRPQLVNMYGITETTVHVSYHPLTRADLSAGSLIGRAIEDLQSYLLDQHLELVPVGVAGELHIGGDGLARGYLNRPQLTAQRFIPNPYSSKPGARLYKTGDLARYLPDGNIEYLGRIDRQVKLRGFRVELGEIEAVLSQHPAIRESVVMVRAEEPDDKRLVAYLVCKPGGDLSSRELREFLQQSLPEYMLPAAYVRVEALPLTPNGKIDRRALPSPPTLRPQLENNYSPPRTEVERIVTSIWQDTLGQQQVGIYDNFFDLGGHSLLLVKMHRKLCARFQYHLPIAELFRHPTISSLSAYLTAQEEEVYMTRGRRRAEIRRAQRAAIEQRK